MNESLTITYRQLRVQIFRLNSVIFNDSQGRELAFFTVLFPRHANQSQGRIFPSLIVGLAHPEPVRLHKVTITFSSDDSQSWPDVGVTARQSDTNSLLPDRISRVNMHQAVVSYGNLGYVMESENLKVGIRISSLDPVSNINHSVSMKVDFTLFESQPVLIGHSYSGEAIYHVVAMPDGFIYVSDSPQGNAW